jgi:hypothetical protein
MRARNIVLFVLVCFAAFGAYIVINLGGQVLFSPTHNNGHVQASSSTIRQLHFIGSFVVTALAGASLCRFVDSAVPLKWCLGLGVIFAGMYLLPLLLLRPPEAHVNVPARVWLFTVAEALGYVLVPVLGGYLVKRRNIRVN